MKTWNIGNTTVRNPRRLREALGLLVETMGGRPFGRAEQQDYLNHMVAAGLVESKRVTAGDDGGRKFASAFKQLGFVTDWQRGRAWNLTDVGRLLRDSPQLEDSIFLRQLLKYQIPSPLERERTTGFNLRPFRVLLHFLKRAFDEGLVGLTKAELALFVITTLDEDTAIIDAVWHSVTSFRASYEARKGNVAKKKFIGDQLKAIANAIGLKPGTLMDYADSNSRYAYMSGLLTLKGNKLAISDSKISFVNSLLTDTSVLLSDDEYLKSFYDPALPKLPSDNEGFIREEVERLSRALHNLSILLNEPDVSSYALTTSNINVLHAEEARLRKEFSRLREIQFYREQSSDESLRDIEDWLENIREGNLIGGEIYAPAFFEWAVWRLFLAINQIEGEIASTRGFNVDEDLRPLHHARGGAADLKFTYSDFALVCEMTLTAGSRQFAAEGEPVTRHVFQEIERMTDKKVYGLFVARKLDPNTLDAFHNARYWKDWKQPVLTPVVAVEISFLCDLARHARTTRFTPHAFRQFLDEILLQQASFASGPEWYQAYSVRLITKLMTQVTSSH